MKIFNLLLAVLLFTVSTSCTLEKTDYEAELETTTPEDYDFKEALTFNSNGYQVSVETLQGAFFKGYNELRMRVVKASTNQPIQNAEILFLPIRSDVNEVLYSCPHDTEVLYNSEKGYFTSYAVFDYKSDTNTSWEMYLNITVNNESFAVESNFEVVAQPNMNLGMTSFIGNDQKQYYIALIAPTNPSVSENELVAGVYQYNPSVITSENPLDPSQFSYSSVSNATLLLDPRMPEPSMGNHSSPNNKDLTQAEDGLYYGVVNYTMTGNWTLNFILQNANGEVIKGTEVPTDFTPGIEGTKSELYIDVLF